MLGTRSAAQGEILNWSWDSKAQHMLMSTTYNGSIVVWGLKRQNSDLSLQDSNARRYSVLPWSFFVATLPITFDDAPSPLFSAYSFGSNNSLLGHVFPGSAFVVGMIFATQLLSWCIYEPQNNRDFLMLESNFNWFNSVRLLKDKGIRRLDHGRDGVVVQAELPLELLEDIGKRLVSRPDIICFRSVCKTWRLCLPPRTRFPLKVPGPPYIGKHLSHVQNAPYFITEVNFYSVDQQMIVAFEDFDEGGKFVAFAWLPKGADFDFPTTTSPDFSRLSLVAKAYRVRLALPLEKRVEGNWGLHNTSVMFRKIVLISSDPDVAVDDPMSAVSVVAHMAGTGRLAVLRLRESQDPNWAWEYDFCPTMFEDIATYKGQLCALDFSRRAFLMDYNSLEMIEIAAPFFSNILRVHLRSKVLFEVCGDLYLVTTSKKVEPRYEVKVYKLSFQLHKWLEADDIYNHHVFLRDTYFNLAVPRDAIPRFYDSWMEKCKAGHDYSRPPCMIVPKDGGFSTLGITTPPCIPWISTQQASTASTMTKMASIISQYDVCIPDRTDFERSLTVNFLL